MSLVGVGGTDQSSAASNHAATLPDHCDHGARAEVVHQGGEEGTLGEVAVVLLSELLGLSRSMSRRSLASIDSTYGGQDLDGHQLVALAFKASDDLSYKGYI